MTRPENPFEALSYDLNQFRERRMVERRSAPRATADRRSGPVAVRSPEQASQTNGNAPGTMH